MVTIQLIKPFKDTNYDVCLGSARTSASQAGSANDQVYKSTFTTTSFQMYINDTSGNTIYWHAVGQVNLNS